MRKPLVALSALLLLTTPGCATLFGGGSSETLIVNIENQPEDVKVVITGLSNGERLVQHQSSFTMPISRQTDYQITVSAPGFEESTVVLHRNVRALFWANFCLGGILGMGIDYVSNNMWEHDRINVSLELERVRKDKDGALVMPIVLTNLDNGERIVLEAPMTPLRSARK